MNIRKLKMKLVVIMVALFATIYNIPVYADEIEVNTVEEYTEPVINGIVVEVENNEEEIVLEQQDSQEEPVELETVEEIEITAEEETIEVAVENPVEEETATEQESIEVLDEIEITDEQEQVEESSEIVEEELTEESTTEQEDLEAAEESQAEEISGYTDLVKGDSAWTFTSSKEGQFVSLVIDKTKSTTDDAGATGSNNYRTFTFKVGKGDSAPTYTSYIYMAMVLMMIVVLLLRMLIYLMARSLLVMTTLWMQINRVFFGR